MDLVAILSQREGVNLVLLMLMGEENTGDRRAFYIQKLSRRTLWLITSRRKASRERRFKCIQGP